MKNLFNQEILTFDSPIDWRSSEQLHAALIKAFKFYFYIYVIVIYIICSFFVLYIDQFNELFEYYFFNSFANGTDSILSSRYMYFKNIDGFSHVSYIVCSILASIFGLFHGVYCFVLFLRYANIAEKSRLFRSRDLTTAFIFLVVVVILIYSNLYFPVGFSRSGGIRLKSMMFLWPAYPFFSAFLMAFCSLSTCVLLGLAFRFNNMIRSS